MQHRPKYLLLLGFERPRVYKWARESVKKRNFDCRLPITKLALGERSQSKIGNWKSAINHMSFRTWLQDLFGGGSTQRRTPQSGSLPDDPNVDPYNPFPEIVEIAITDVLDLHTIPPRDVARVVEEYLEQGHRAGFRAVRIIHGKGIGVQREIVRSILTRTSFVDEWTDAPPEAGGLGATIVRLR